MFPVIFFYTIMAPLYIIIICRIVGEMEQKNNNWTFLLSMPLKKNRIYFIKMFALTGMVLLHYLGYLMGILLVKVILNDFKIAFGSILLDLLVSFLCTFSIISFLYFFIRKNIINSLFGHRNYHSTIWIFGITIRKFMGILSIKLSFCSSITIKWSKQIHFCWRCTYYSISINRLYTLLEKRMGLV
ncbi:hypothetical protein EXQ43_02550 [Clostridium botulinum]|nr:hypothetical protein [Clostridium botulinum]